jgi:hypothetical protein
MMTCWRSSAVTVSPRCSVLLLGERVVFGFGGCGAPVGLLGDGVDGGLDVVPDDALEEGASHCELGGAYGCWGSVGAVGEAGVVAHWG